MLGVAIGPYPREQGTVLDALFVGGHPCFGGGKAVIPCRSPQSGRRLSSSVLITALLYTLPLLTLQLSFVYGDWTTQGWHGGCQACAMIVSRPSPATTFRRTPCRSDSPSSRAVLPWRVRRCGGAGIMLHLLENFSEPHGQDTAVHCVSARASWNGRSRRRNFGRSPVPRAEIPP
jgi:hypothetical protein